MFKFNETWERIQFIIYKNSQALSIARNEYNV